MGDEISISSLALGALGALVNRVVSPTDPDPVRSAPIHCDPAALAKSYWEAEMAGDLDRLMACYHSDAEFVTAHRAWIGSQAIRERYEEAARQYTAIRVRTGQTTVQGSRAAIPWTAHFVPVSGDPYFLTGLNVFWSRGRSLSGLTATMKLSSGASERRDEQADDCPRIR